MLVDAESTPILLATRSDPPLAVVAAARRHDHQRTVPPGETLLLYTHGLVECRADDLETRQAELLQTVAGSRAAELDERLTPSWPRWSATGRTTTWR